MISEPGTATYTDALLIAEIVRYPLPDSAGEWPYLTSGSVNTGWTPLYDFAAVAADLWTEKASAVSDSFDFTADGATFHKEQLYTHRMKQARYYRARRAPSNHTALVYPGRPATELWIANLNDPYE